MNLTELDTGIPNPLRAQVNQWLSNSLESQRRYRARTQSEHGDIGLQFSSLMESSHLRRMSETMAQEFAKSSLGVLQTTMNDLTARNVTSMETALHLSSLSVWTMKAEGVEALVTQSGEGGWMTLVSQPADGIPNIMGVPWQQKPDFMETDRLEVMILEDGVKAVMEALDTNGWNSDIYSSPEEVLNDAVADKVYHDKYAFSMKARKFRGEKEAVITFDGAADLTRLTEYLEMMGPFLSNHRIPISSTLSTACDENDSLYEDDLVERAVALDGGIPGITCAVLLRDTLALQRGQAVLEAAENIHDACTVLEKAGNTLGCRLVYNDLDERISMARAEDGCSMAMLYENISYCGHPREFLLVARWPEGVPDEAGIPAMLEVYPVFPDSADDDNMTAVDMEAEGYEPKEIAEQLVFEAGKSSSMAANPPRPGVRDLVVAWQENRLPAPYAVLDTVELSFRLDDPYDCTVAACWGVDATLRWKAEGAEKSKDNYGRKDERFTVSKPAALLIP